MHSDLGRVVQAIIREFSKNPPQLLEEISPGSVKSHRGECILKTVNYVFAHKKEEKGTLLLMVQITDLQGRNSPSYSLQQYSEIPPTSFNSYYTTQFPQFSSASASTCIYNYNHTNSGTTYVNDGHTKFSSSSQHSTYIPNSRSDSLHNADTARYKANQQGTYLNSHYANANYHQQSLTNQTKTPQSVTFPELNGLTNEELKLLSEDDDRLDEFLDKHSDLKDINTAIDDAIDWVQKTAGKCFMSI